jgi:hypothetical protein
MNSTALLYLLTGALKNTLDLEHSYKSENSINFENLKYIKENNKRYIRTSAPEDHEHLLKTYFKIITLTPIEQIDPNSYQFLKQTINKLRHQRDEIYNYLNLDKNPENVNKEEYTDMAEYMDNITDNLEEMHRILNIEFTPLYFKCRSYGYRVDQLTEFIYKKNPQFNNTPIDQIQINYPQKKIYEEAKENYQLVFNKLNENYKE